MNGSERIDNDRIQAEIGADAEKWRRQHPEISEIEKDMKQAWAAVIPAVPAMDDNDILEQTVHLAHLNPNVLIESRLGFRRLKQLIRKLSYWYVRFVTDQFNIFAGMLNRWIRKSDTRISRLEHVVFRSPKNFGFSSHILSNTLPSPSPEIATQVAAIAGLGPSLVLSGGTGSIVQTINDNGGNAYGVEPDTSRLLASLKHRIDVRQGDISSYLINANDAEFEAIVFSEIVEALTFSEIHHLIEQATRVLSPTGRIVVAASDPKNRHQIQAELYVGLGISPRLWRHLLEDTGMNVRLLPSTDERITEIVVAEWPANDVAVQANGPRAVTGSQRSMKDNTRKTVDLLIPHLSTGDATSNHTRLLGDIIESKGFNVRIISETAKGSKANEISIKDWVYEGNLSILQHSIGSRLATLIIQEQIPIVLNYHNVTPSHFFTNWHLGLEKGVELGRQQLQELSTFTRRAIADSEFNAIELRNMNFRDVAVSPVLWELADFKAQTSQVNSAIPKDSGTILFVGRIAPNKCHQDLISALAMLSQKRARSRLLLIGDASPAEYLASLKAFAQRLGVIDQIVFAGKVSDHDLLRSYKVADVFASASEHEGFGVPLVEAMANGLPVVAYDAAAVAETLQGAGIVLADKRPATLSSALDRVLGDQQLRNDLRDRGIKSAQRFDISVTRDKMWSALEDLLDE